jgi:3-phosphoshikimate 1-carboxyvinyltransferase
MGAVAVCGGPGGAGGGAGLGGRRERRPASFQVPADPSSAAFPLAAAAAASGSRVVLGSVGLNPLRGGLLTTLREMGAAIEVQDARTVAGEEIGDLVVHGGPLRGVEVPAARAPSMIDEYPVLAVAATRAHGRTTMRGLAELRVKESDRLAVMAEGLAACGVAVSIEGDDLIVEGGRRPRGGATIDARLDHRIAMSFLVLGGLSEAPVLVRGAQAIATSFPGFEALMNSIGARIEAVEPVP